MTVLYGFTPKLHDTKFSSYHLIISILKLFFLSKKIMVNLVYV